MANPKVYRASYTNLDHPSLHYFALYTYPPSCPLTLIFFEKNQTSKKVRDVWQALLALTIQVGQFPPAVGKKKKIAAASDDSYTRFWDDANRGQTNKQTRANSSKPELRQLLMVPLFFSVHVKYQASLALPRGCPHRRKVKRLVRKFELFLGSEPTIQSMHIYICVCFHIARYKSSWITVNYCYITCSNPRKKQ